MEAHEESHLPEWSIALSLLAGFWFMLLLDTAAHLLPSASSSSSSSSAGQPPNLDTAVGEGDGDEHVILLSDVQQQGDGSKGQAGNSRPPTPQKTPRMSTAAPGTSHQAWPGVTTGSSRSAAGTSASVGGGGREARSSSGSPAKRAGLGSAGGSFRQLPPTSAREEAAAAAAVRSGGGAGSSLAARAAAGPAGQKLDAAAAAGGGMRAAAWGGAAAGQLLAGWLREPAQQALLGLIVHAASDGLAVGAASLASEPAVSLSVAAAMVVHKGPVAVGLAAYLRSARWPPSRVHKGILLFSLASPAAALLTYLALSALPFLSVGSNIALAVLFSGGTVLYAATMHILPGALGRHSHLQHQHQHGGSSAAGAGLSLKGRSSKDGMQPVAVQQRGQLLLVSLGMLLPLVLSAVFHHDHHGH
ncbi:Zinc/iron permease [Scenedesmus sp. NREL 46B-D3]|nr:Zinc/iron permease [Scenedesmus sp. NREL 46B-D3]